jgi:N-methylhydantoinase A
MADLSGEFAAAAFTSTEAFDNAAVDAAMEELESRCDRFAQDIGANGASSAVEFVAEARLARQVWEIDVPLHGRRFGASTEAVDRLRDDFRRRHEEIFAVRDDYSAVDVVGLRARVTVPVAGATDLRLAGESGTAAAAAQSSARRSPKCERSIYFSGHGHVAAVVRTLESMIEGEPISGPAVIESPFSTIVLDPAACAQRHAGGSLVVTVQEEQE